MSKRVSQQPLDLFGQPIAEPVERRGRPQHQFKTENAELIAVLSAAGRTQAEIAGLVGLSEKTLVKHYSRSLERGHELIVGATLIETFRALKKGRGWAANLLLKRLEGELDAAPRGAVRRLKAAAPAAPAKVGKKEAAQARGETAHEGTDWDGLLRH